MTARAREILQQALSLSEQEREHLIEALLQSIPAEAAAEIDQAWDEEAVRRAEALERDEVAAVDGPRALEDLRLRLVSRGR